MSDKICKIGGGMTKEERQKYNKAYGEANKDKIKTIMKTLYVEAQNWEAE